MLTLWDLLPKALRPKPLSPPAAISITTRPVVVAKPAPAPAKPAPRSASRSASKPRRKSAREGAAPKAKVPTGGAMQERYDRVVAEMLAKYGVRVRRWRTSMSGVAWTVTYRDGTVSRLIESPKPRGPMSAAVFLHEIGHHALGIGSYKPRCLEEYHAWVFSIQAMEASGLNVTDAVRTRMRRSLEYAVRKAERRGIQSIPPELLPYVRTPPGR